MEYNEYETRTFSTQKAVQNKAVCSCLEANIGCAIPKQFSLNKLHSTRRAPLYIEPNNIHFDGATSGHSNINTTKAALNHLGRRQRKITNKLIDLVK